ncbi:hypothetical protein AA106556_1655 [Neokomagataea tanensis NBRC 106556]|uniref:Transposase n=1 Tax=Neokomagataea tanensis NBRC 106556 TaxID=1223519 RepID=A0ABQ0QKF3_9PROT|nr:hypothetical protein AA106556_1655 [Neokomagataea tanensis NBRC 106556]
MRNSIYNILITCRDNYAPQISFQRSESNLFDHGAPTNLRKGLARKARGGKSGRDNNNRLHTLCDAAHPRRRQS